MKTASRRALNLLAYCSMGAGVAVLVALVVVAIGEISGPGGPPTRANPCPSCGQESLVMLFVGSLYLAQAVGAERRSKIVRWIVGIGVLLVAVAIALPYLAIHSSTCLDFPADSRVSSGCTELYFIEPFGWTLGAWFGIVGGAIVIGAGVFVVLGGLVTGGVLFQRYMDKREGG